MMGVLEVLAATSCPEGIETAILGCTDIWGILKLILQIMTYGVAAAGVLGLVISGIQYMTASGDASKMTKAKNRIVQVVIGLVLYGLMWVILNWLIPGGLTGAGDSGGSEPEPAPEAVGVVRMVPAEDGALLADEALFVDEVSLADKEA